MRHPLIWAAALALLPSLAAAHAGGGMSDQQSTTQQGTQAGSGLTAPAGGSGMDGSGGGRAPTGGHGGAGGSGGSGGSGATGTGSSPDSGGGGKTGLTITIHDHTGLGGGPAQGGGGGGIGGGGVSGAASGAGGENTALTAEQAAALLQGHHIADPHPTKPQGMATMDPAPQSAPPPAAQEAPANLGGKVFISNLDGRGKALTGQEKESADGYRAAAENRWKMKDYKGVVEETNRALAIDPSDEASLRRQGEAYAKLRDYADAETALQRAVAVDSADAKAAEYLAWAQLKRKKPQEAIDSATKALQADPNDAAALAIRAFAEEMLGMRDKALADIEAAAAKDPRYKEKADLARAGKRMYDPDEDLAADLAGGRRGAVPPWLPWVAGPAALVALVLTVLGAASRKNAAAAAPLPSQTPTMPATQLGGRIGSKYELLRPLGRGGMGEVHEAMDHTLGRVVAVKSMAASLGPLGSKGREMFVREARTVASLHHPAVVEIYEMVEHGETLYLVFELVRGKTLSSILAQRKLSPEEALRIMEPVCEALDFAHGQGLVHRDIKPANIMITDQGRVKLMDFGIARSLAETRRKTPVAPGGVPAEGVTVIGTPSYMAPEARAGQLRKESDVYALGVTLYEMLAGVPPLEGAAAPLAAYAPGTPAAVDAVIAAALQPDPDRRTRTPGELLGGLRRALGAA
jgi:tetratricopeptide (TPR) repeat protein